MKKKLLQIEKKMKWVEILGGAYYRHSVLKSFMGDELLQ